MTSAEARQNRWLMAAAIAWMAAFIGLLIHRTGLFSHHPTLARTTLDVYQLAGERWLHGEYLYPDRRGFVYGPLFAALFTPFAWLPQKAGVVLWITLNFAVLVAGFLALLHCGIFPKLAPAPRSAAWLLLLPLALGNLDVLQANPLVCGLILAAYAAAWRKHWTAAAICIALVTHCKIYPLAAGLLLMLFAPWRFSWRLALAVLALGLLPFLFQHWDYVRDEYHAWFVTRTGDNRLQYSEKDAPLDLYYVLSHLAGVTVGPLAYRAMQVLAGGAIALFQLVGIWRRWPREKLFAGSFLSLSIWMTLIGPATEAYTYILAAPAAVILLTQSWARPSSWWIRGLATLGVGFLLFAVARASFFPHLHTAWAMSAQPLGTIALLSAMVGWIVHYFPEQKRHANGTC